MANTKMTRVEALKIALAVVDTPEAREVLARMIEQLSKPRAASSSKTPTRANNEALVTELYKQVEHGQTFDTAYVMQSLNGVLTPQKAVGIMRVGIEQGLFEKYKEGKRTMYRAL